MGKKSKHPHYTLDFATHALLQSTQDDNENSESDPQPEDDLDASDNELIKTMQNKAIDRGAFTFISRQKPCYSSF